MYCYRDDCDDDDDAKNNDDDNDDVEYGDNGDE